MMNKQQAIQAQHAAFERLWRETYLKARPGLTVSDLLSALNRDMITGRTAADILDRILKERTV